MANNLLGFSAQGFKANAATAKAVVVMLHSVEGEVVVTTAITDMPFGVTLTSAAAGAPIALQTHGVAKVTASGIIALGAQVVASADGKVETFTGVGATALSMGVALQASAAAGDIIEVQLSTPAVFGPANA